MSVHSTPSRVQNRPPSPVAVGCDGSPWGRAALFWAADHASRTGAELDVWTWDVGGGPDLTSRHPELRPGVHRAGPEPVRDLEASALRVVHAAPLHTKGDALATDPQFVLDHAARLLDQLDPRPSYATTLLRFHPHEAISRYTDSDLLVVGSGDHHDLTGRCGSVTKAAVHHASCPVLVVRRPPSRNRLEAFHHVPDRPAAGRPGPADARRSGHTILDNPVR